MSRLFQKRNNYNHRETLHRKRKRKVWVAFEGVSTEPKYFEELKNLLSNNDEVICELMTLHRAKNDGKSHPYHVKNGLIQFYNEHKESFDDNDSLWIVIDIDKHFGSGEKAKEKYLNFLNTLKTNGQVEIKAAISKPCFELWLLLHYEDVEKLDLVKLKNNKKTGKQTYAKRLLNKYEDQQNINNLDNVTLALSRAKHSKLEQDINRLIDNVGTLVYLLIEELFK
jgi:hypothetical protein